MASVKPMQAWALEQQQQRDDERRPVATAAIMPVAAAMPKFRENTTEPIHNWAASDARGAEFAQRGELQRRDYEQRGKLQDKEFGQQKDLLNYKMQLQQKYAPKKGRGGLGPVAKDVNEYLKIASGPPAADERQATANQARLKLIEARLARMGRSGQSAVEELRRVGLTPDAYSPTANKQVYERETLDTKASQQAERDKERMAAQAESTAMRVLAGLPDMKAPKDAFMEDPAVAKARESKIQAVRDKASKAFDRSKYEFKNGQWVEKD